MPKDVKWEELDEEDLEVDEKEVEVDEEGVEEEGMEEFVDEYLRQQEAAVSVPWPLLTFVEAEALPRGAAVELQPLALSSSQHDSFQGALQCCHSEGCLMLVSRLSIHCTSGIRSSCFGRCSHWEHSQGLCVLLQ